MSPYATADERILDYTIEVVIATDGSLDVTEHITARVEGEQIRRGIYRDFPTRYEDRYGNRVVVDLQVLDVQRNGMSEPWFTENRSNGVRINTGSDDFLPAPQDHTFTLRYRTTRQLGFFEDHDELYWNAIGTGWAFPIDQARVEVRLPKPVPADQLTAEGYTGSEGATGTDYTATTSTGEAQWRLARPLQAGEGFTVALSFPKGVVEAPNNAQRAAWFLKDNRGVLVALIGLVLLAWYCIYQWRRIGRDPRQGVIIARYEPPSEWTPSSLRFLMQMGYDMRCFSADVLALAVAGHVRIERGERLLKDEWSLHRVSSAASAPVDPTQQLLLDKLFSSGSQSLTLKNTNAGKISKACQAHSKAIDKLLRPRHFRTNGSSVVKAFLIALASMLIAFFTAAGAGIPTLIGIAVVMIATLITFGFLIRAPSQEGRVLMDEIEGLKLYMSVAERDELASIEGPGAPPVLDAKRYESLLPFAVALDVEEAWTKKLTVAIGAAAAVEVSRSIAWYHGGATGDLGNLTQALGSTLTSQIASSSRPPGSSSGSGGGGSVGGGGGGGGGGGR